MLPLSVITARGQAAGEEGRRERQAQERGRRGVSSETSRPHPGQRGKAESPELTALPEKCCLSDKGQQFFPGLADRQPASSKVLLPKAARLWGPWTSCIWPAGLLAHLENTWRVRRQSLGLPMCPRLPEPSSQVRTRKRCSRPVVAGVLGMRIHTNPLRTVHAHPQDGDSDPAGPAAVSRGGWAEETRGEKDVHTKQLDRLTDEGAGTGCLGSGSGGGPGLQKHALPLSKQTFLPRGPVLPRSPGAPAVPPLPWSRRRGERQ